MDKKAHAAKLWAALEQRLIGRLGLRDGLTLQAERPHMIRLIGDELVAEPVSVLLDDSAPRARPMTARRMRSRPAAMPSDSAIDAMLNGMLDRACSRRTGYDGDDEAGYSPH